MQCDALCLFFFLPALPFHEKEFFKHYQIWDAALMRRKKIETNISFKQTEIIFYLILPQSYNDDDDMVEGYKWHHYTKI